MILLSLNFNQTFIGVFFQKYVLLEFQNNTFEQKRLQMFYKN